MNAGHIDPAAARLVLWGLRLANSTIRYMEEQGPQGLEEKHYPRLAASEPVATSALSPSSSIKYVQLLRKPIIVRRPKASS